MVAELARAIEAIARDDTDTARAIIADVAKLVAAPSQPGGTSSAKGRKQAAVRLIGYWRTECDHPRAKASQERIRAIMARLREGFSEAEIRKAIDGAAADAFVSPSGQRHDDLTLICRNASKLESFIARGSQATGPVVEERDGDRLQSLMRAAAAAKRSGKLDEYERLSKEIEDERRVDQDEQDSG